MPPNDPTPSCPFPLRHLAERRAQIRQNPVERNERRGCSRDHHVIMSCSCPRRGDQPDGFPQTALGPITHNGATDTLTGGEADTDPLLVVMAKALQDQARQSRFWAPGAAEKFGSRFEAFDRHLIRLRGVCALLPGALPTHGGPRRLPFGLESHAGAYARAGSVGTSVSLNLPCLLEKLGDGLAREPAV